MKCEIKSSCSGCQQTDHMTVDPGSNITLNCSTSTGKIAQGMTWKQAKQEVQNSACSTDLALLQSNSSTNSDSMSCDCTAVYFTRMCLLICLVLIFKIQNCRKLSFNLFNTSFLMLVSEKWMIALHMLVFYMASGWVLPEKNWVGLYVPY